MRNGSSLTMRLSAVWCRQCQCSSLAMFILFPQLHYVEIGRHENTILFYHIIFSVSTCCTALLQPGTWSASPSPKGTRLRTATSPGDSKLASHDTIQVFYKRSIESNNFLLLIMSQLSIHAFYIIIVGELKSFPKKLFQLL